MADYLPLYHDGNGESVPYRAAEAITGGQLVEISGDNLVKVATAATTKFVGVAAYDVKAGDLLTTYRNGTQLLVASGTIAAGDLVVAAAGGKVATSASPATGTQVGEAAKGAADGQIAEIIWKES